MIILLFSVTAVENNSVQSKRLVSNVYAKTCREHVYFHAWPLANHSTERDPIRLVSAAANRRAVFIIWRMRMRESVLGTGMR